MIVVTKKEFVKKIARGERDLLQEFIDFLEQKKTPYCVIGGLAVNAYAEPVVSLDLDVVVAAEVQGTVVQELSTEYSLKEEKHSINISAPFSDLRIQIQTDPRYQAFVARAGRKDVLGYKLPVATLEDVLQGKLWAYSDPERRPSKRQKDLADIMRLVETHPSLLGKLPRELQERIRQ